MINGQSILLPPNPVWILPDFSYNVGKTLSLILKVTQDVQKTKRH